MKKTLAQQAKYAGLVSASSKGFSGGGDKPKAIDPKTTDFDIVFVGKLFFILQSATSEPCFG